MEATDLAFFTSDELIAELMRRKTFYGCVVHAQDDHKHEAWQERTFRLHYNRNLNQDQAGRLLNTVADYISWQAD